MQTQLQDATVTHNARMVRHVTAVRETAHAGSRRGNGSRKAEHAHEQVEVLVLSLYLLLDAVSGGQLYHGQWMSRLRIPPVPAWTAQWFFDLKDQCSGRKGEVSQLAARYPKNLRRPSI